MTIALALGKSLKEVQEHITLDELVLWQAYHELHGPFDIPLDVLIGEVCTVLASCHYVKGRKPKLKDFLWFRSVEKPKNKQENLRAWVLANSKPKPQS